MPSIKTKIISAYTLVFGCLLLVFAYFIYVRTEEAEMQKIDARLQSYAARITTDLEEEENEALMARDKRTALQQQINRFPGLHAQFIAQNGEMLASDTVLAKYQMNASQEVLMQGQRPEVLSIDGQRYRCLWAPLEIGDQRRVVAELAVSMSDVEERLEHLRFAFYAGIPFALVIAALAAYAITRSAFRPITKMVETTRRITAKNLHQRLALPPARDEVRLLGETLNGMIERIEAAFQSQKQFVADASHEIRTPLTVICSELEFAENQTSEPGVKESIQTSLAEIDRLTKLTEGLLMLAKLDSSQLTLDFRSIRLDELLVECVQLINVVARKKNIHIKVNLQDPVVVRADQEKLKSVILNLLDNAVKYSRENTTVTASIIHREARSNAVALIIGDQGPGIPTSVLPDIFKRFYRVDAARSENSGSGLGLAIVQRLVELHGGSITVWSEVGKGTIFTIELPLAPNA